MISVRFALLIVIVILIVAYSGTLTGGAALGFLVAIAGGVLLCGLDDPDVVVGGGLPVKSNGPINLRNVLRYAIRQAKHVAKIAAAGTATVASFGAGGDTIVEVLAIMLDAGMYLGELAMIFLGDASAYATALREIWEIKFDKGVDGVQTAMKGIYERAGDAAAPMVEYLRGVFHTTIEWMLGLFGQVISMVIPDDMAVAGTIVTEVAIFAVRAASHNLFWILQAAYNKALPEPMREVLQNPELMRETMVTSIEFIKKYILTGDSETWMGWLGKHVTRQAIIDIPTATVLGVALLTGPVAGFIVPVMAIAWTGMAIFNVMQSANIGRKQTVALLDALHTKTFHIDHIGEVTAIDAFIMFIQKIIPLTFAGMYVLSDPETADVNPDITKLPHQPVDIEPLPDKYTVKEDPLEKLLQETLIVTPATDTADS